MCPPWDEFFLDGPGLVLWLALYSLCKSHPANFDSLLYPNNANDVCHSFVIIIIDKAFNDTSHEINCFEYYIM